MKRSKGVSKLEARRAARKAIMEFLKNPTLDNLVAIPNDWTIHEGVSCLCVTARHKYYWRPYEVCANSCPLNLKISDGDWDLCEELTERDHELREENLTLAWEKKQGEILLALTQFSLGFSR